MSSSSLSTSTSSSTTTTITTTTTTTRIDNERLQQFMEKILSDFGGAGGCVLAYIGDESRLDKAMSDFGKPITSQELLILLELLNAT